MSRSATASEVRAQGAGPVLRAPLQFALIFSAIFVLHAPLLRLPYFWDEAGYYIPAARDLLLTGDLIPHSTISNAHPPLVLAWLAAWWKLSGYTPAVTRTAMLFVAAFALLGLFRLARQLTTLQVAVATGVCTALYPVFFTQSTMAHLDVAAAGLTFWALSACFGHRRAPAVIFFSLAALAKETAIITPVALFAWELVCAGRIWRDSRRSPNAADSGVLEESSSRLPLGTRLGRTGMLLIPVLPLTAWFAYHFHRTGYVFGNPDFFRYNVAATLHPLRILIALAMRVWQLLGYMNLFILTLAAAMAMSFRPLREAAAARNNGGRGRRKGATAWDGIPGERRPIARSVQLALAVVILAHVVVLAVIGGAVLARYMLPVVPLFILICVSTLRRRLPWYTAVVGIVCVGFLIGLFFNPPWRFAPEDNLAYRDYVLLHKGADMFVAAKYPEKVILTAWPASDELTRPWLGYTSRAVRVLRVENFTLEQVLNALQHRDEFDVVLAFSTKYEPRINLTGLLPFWEQIQTRFFDYHRDLPPDAIARILAGRIVYERNRGGQWVAVIDLEHVENARTTNHF